MTFPYTSEWFNICLGIWFLKKIGTEPAPYLSSSCFTQLKEIRKSQRLQKQLKRPQSIAHMMWNFIYLFQSNVSLSSQEIVHVSFTSIKEMKSVAFVRLRNIGNANFLAHILWSRIGKISHIEINNRAASHSAAQSKEMILISQEPLNQAISR